MESRVEHHDFNIPPIAAGLKMSIERDDKQTLERFATYKVKRMPVYYCSYLMTKLTEKLITCRAFFCEEQVD